MAESWPKRVVITQGELCYLAGTEIVTLELAQEFRGRGAEVQVLTNYTADPMATLFAAAAIPVLEDAALIDWGSVDLVWLHNQYLPASVVQAVLEGACPAVFVAHHMSSYHPLEAPAYRELEDALCAVVSANSAETADMLRASGVFTGEPFLLGNPAPSAFFGDRTAPADPPNRILVVSNHIPPELRSAIDALRDRAIEVDVVGSADEPRRIIPADVVGTDVVVTIGKTVQYALASGTPVYLYDHFGGPGFLTPANHELAAWHNFSGRGFDTKTSGAIVDELLAGPAAAGFDPAHARSAARAEHHLGQRLGDLLDSARGRRPELGGVPPAAIMAHRALCGELWANHRLYRSNHAELAASTLAHEHLAAEFAELSANATRLEQAYLKLQADAEGAVPLAQYAALEAAHLELQANAAQLASGYTDLLAAHRDLEGRFNALAGG